MSPAGDDDVAVSITCFIEKHITFAVMYGCVPDVMEDTTFFVEKLSKTNNLSGFHPMFLPMVYVELERQRLLNVLEQQRTDLNQRILDMEKKLQDEGCEVSKTREVIDPASIERDCKITRLWGDVSSLKNGLMSLRAELLFMSEHLATLQRDMFDKQTIGENDNRYIREEPGDKIKTRLHEMMREFDTKIRQCDGVLEKTALAAQMVSPSRTAVCLTSIRLILMVRRKRTTIRDEMYKRPSS